MTTLTAVERLVAETLQPLYEAGEARAIGCQLLEHILECSRTQLLMLDKDTLLSAEQEESLSIALTKLSTGQPLQYVLGVAPFLEYELMVAPGVLIPRPETEELVSLAIASINQRINKSRLRVLDVGTGSGCIAYAMAAGTSAEVEALELSTEARLVAQANFEELYKQRGTSVRLIMADVLQLCQEPCTRTPYDMIISNPPYIHPEESKEMTEQVLDHEPSMALFAPVDNPTIFYQAIALLAKNGWLAREGEIWAEINPILAEQTLREMSSILIEHEHTASLHLDMSGKQRFIHIRIK